jgi:hypothetical protein
MEELNVSHSTKLGLPNQTEDSLIEEIVDIIDVLSDRLSVIYATETDAREAIERLQRLELAIRTGALRR